MQRALASPVNQRPVRFDDIPRDEMFDPDERQHVDRYQARALKLLLTYEDEYDTIEGGECTPPSNEEDEDA
jgi:hypothetical protein